jgi:zinc transport system substrate-binding protein
MKIKTIAKITFTMLIILCLFIAAACGNRAGTSETSDLPEGRLIVAVSIIPEKTFVEAVCGDIVSVITMIPSGSSPETYEPSPKEMIGFSKALIYFAIGVPVEKESILQQTGDMKVIYLQDDVAAVYPDRMFAAGERDQHIWLSPKRAKVMIASIAREMSLLDEAHADTYTKNANAYIALLDELDSQISSALEGIKNRKFIVYHPAFGYFAEDYGLEMYALEEEGKEATPQHLQAMLDLAEKENIKVIFYQEEIDSRQSEAFAEEIGGKTMKLSPLAADYIDNLKSMTDLMAEVMK